MKNAIYYLKIAIANAIAIQFFSCKTQDKGCVSMKKPIEIIFEDSTLHDICLSPGLRVAR